MLPSPSFLSHTCLVVDMYWLYIIISRSKSDRFLPNSTVKAAFPQPAVVEGQLATDNEIVLVVMYPSLVKMDLKNAQNYTSLLNNKLVFKNEPIYINLYVLGEDRGGWPCTLNFTLKLTVITFFPQGGNFQH